MNEKINVTELCGDPHDCTGCGFCTRATIPEQIESIMASLRIIGAALAKATGSQ